MKKVEKFWEKRSLEFEDKIEGVLFKSLPLPLNKYLHKWMLSEILQVLDKNKNLKVLDIGCGYGRLSQPLIQKFPKIKIFGIDISSHYVNLFNKFLKPRGLAVKGDIKKLPFKKGSFDVVFMVTTLMYVTAVKEQEIVVSEIMRVLKPNGKFVFIERNSTGYSLVTLWGMITKIRGKKNKEIDATSFSPNKMIDLIKRNEGFILGKKGIPTFTILLIPLIMLAFVNENFLNRLLKLISSFDNKLSRLLTISLYISYIGGKQR